MQTKMQKKLTKEKLKCNLEWKENQLLYWNTAKQN